MRAAFIISCLMLSYSVSGSADISIRYDSVSNNQKLPYHSLSLKNGMVRVDQAADSERSVMVDLQSGDIVQLHSPSRRYFRINARTIGQYASFYQRNRSMLQGLIDHGLSQLDPQKREQVQQFIDNYEEGARSLGQLSMRPSNKVDEVLGTRCSVFGIYHKGQLQREVCVSSYQQLGLDPNDIRNFELLREFIQQFSETAPADKQQLLAMLSTALVDMQGVPMKIVNYYPNGRVRNIIQAGAISLRSIPAQAYRIPDDFQEHNVPLL